MCTHAQIIRSYRFKRTCDPSWQSNFYPRTPFLELEHPPASPKEEALTVKEFVAISTSTKNELEAEDENTEEKLPEKKDAPQLPRNPKYPKGQF